MTQWEHERCRSAVLAGDELAESLDEHLADCPSCAQLARSVASIRRVGPTVGGPALAPPDLADRVIAAFRASVSGSGSASGSTPVSMPAHTTPARAPSRRFSQAVFSRAAVIVAVVGVGVALLVPQGTGTAGADDLAEALLVTAQRTEDEGTARLEVQGRSDLVVDGEPVPVVFGGVGEMTASRLHYRGLTRMAGAVVPSELTVVGDRAWARRRDGTWLRVAEPVGALAPVVLDAGSVLELLRLPKERLTLIGQDETTRTVRFTVSATPALTYQVVATFGRDDALLREVDVAAAGDGWRTQATMRLYGFGAPVTIHPPAEHDVVGSWGDAPAATKALFPFG